MTTRSQVLLAWSLSFCVHASVGHAEVADPFEQEVLEQAKAISPLVAKAMEDGKAASDRHDAQAALRSYLEAVRLAPSFNHALRRACGVEATLKQHDAAEAHCRRALEADRSARNLAALSFALLGREVPSAQEEAAKLVSEAIELAPELYVTHQASFELASARNDRAGMRSAYQQIARTSKEPFLVAYYEAFLAYSLIADKPDSAARDEANRLAASAFEDTKDDPVTLARIAQVGLAVDDIALTRRATHKLEQTAPKFMSTHYFLGIVAAIDGNWDKARSALTEARKYGLDEAEYERLIDKIDEAEPWIWRALPVALRVFLAWLGCMVVLLASGAVMSVLTMRSAAKLPAESTGKSTGSNLLLRRAYAAVIFLACLFYYVSLPLVMLSVIAVAGALIYGFFVIGHVPIKLVLIIAAIALVSVWAVLKSLFVRPRDADPGTPLDLTRQPALRALLDEVAAKVGTRAVDKVYLEPGTSVAVFERGGMMQTLSGHSERCLVLGLGVLDGMGLHEFKAILAHEYGHFSNRDTAGGGLALAVRRSMIAMARALAEGGAATWYNPAWWFFRGFFSAFLRVSQGASRLQEVLADRWAAFSYGSEAFVRGLSHVIERSVRFDAQANAALKPLVEARAPITNFYAHVREAVVTEEDVAREVEEAITRKPSPYDSHPAPSDRILWVRGLAVPDPSEESDTEVWSLFEHREELERTMTQEVNQAFGLHQAGMPPLG